MRAGPPPRPPMRAATAAVAGAAAGCAAGWALGRWHASASKTAEYKATVGEGPKSVSQMGHSDQLLTTPLHEAAKANNAEAVRRLLASTADPHAMAAAKDQSDFTPIMRAAYLGNAQAAEALLEAAPEVAMIACDGTEGWWLPVHAGKLSICVAMRVAHGDSQSCWCELVCKLAVSLTTHIRLPCLPCSCPEGSHRCTQAAAPGSA